MAIAAGKPGRVLFPEETSVRAYRTTDRAHTRSHLPDANHDDHDSRAVGCYCRMATWRLARPHAYGILRSRFLHSGVRDWLHADLAFCIAMAIITCAGLQPYFRWPRPLA